LPSRSKTAKRILKKFFSVPDLPRIVFFHVPKCGGTSIHDAIKDGLKKKYGLRRVPLFHLDTHASHLAAEAFGTDREEHREQLLLYNLGLPHLALVDGHFPFSRRVLKMKNANDVFITVLRHPYSRLLSDYYYSRYKTHRQDDRARLAIEADIDGWLASADASYMATHLVRFFSGSLDFHRCPIDAVPPELMSQAAGQAIRNLETFDVVGDVKDLDTFARRLRERTGVDVRIGHRLSSPKSRYPAFEDQPEPVRRRVSELCAPDLRIYEAVLGTGGTGAAEDGTHPAPQPASAAG
jgi:hypothetical protein